MVTMLEVATMFDLSEVLKGVSNPGTGREQIEYISLDLIDRDPKNFYELNGIDYLGIPRTSMS